MKNRHLSGPTRAAGFTLVEMMITVAIVGILTGIALPSFQNNVVKTRRTDVQQKLVSQAQSMERYYSTNGRYVDTTPGDVTCGVAAPAASVNYTFAVVCAANTFTMTATPVTTSMQKNDGTQTLDNTGTKGGSLSGGNWAK